MYFLLIRPQRRRMREQQALQRSIRSRRRGHHHLRYLRLRHRRSRATTSGSRSPTTSDPHRPPAVSGASRPRTTPSRPLRRRARARASNDDRRTPTRPATTTTQGRRRHSVGRLSAAEASQPDASRWSVIVVIPSAARRHPGVGNTPMLGLDLQGGLSVILQPTGKADRTTLDRRHRDHPQPLDSLGVAEPDIIASGQTPSIVDLPGVKDQDRALELVGRPASSRSARCCQASVPATRPTAVAPARPRRSPARRRRRPTPRRPRRVDRRRRPRPRRRLRRLRRRHHRADHARRGAPTTTAAAPSVAGARSPAGTRTTADHRADRRLARIRRRPGDLRASARPSRTGRGRSSAPPRCCVADGEWVVDRRPQGGDRRASTTWNTLARRVLQRQRRPLCPTGSWRSCSTTSSSRRPAVRRAELLRQHVRSQITGDVHRGRGQGPGTGAQATARSPSSSKPQAVQTVSPTLGKDSLHAGIIAGLVGLAARAALHDRSTTASSAVVVVAGLIVWRLPAVDVISSLSKTQGLALTLAGVDRHHRVDRRHGRLLRRVTSSD